MTEWLKIKAKFPNKCILCNTVGIMESDSRLIIFDKNDDSNYKKS
jgi:hypothetical protein